MYKKIIAGVFAAAMALSAALPAAADTEQTGSFKISNEYISLFVDNDARFSMGTVEGNPNSDTDNDANLLFKYTSEYVTSYASYVVDGFSYRFCGSDLTSYVSDDGKSCTATREDGDISITREISFIKNISTGREDVAKISYTVTNNGTETHTVGGRILLDTMLGKNDGAPFRVPGVGAVLNETEFEGDDIPAYWQAFDSFTDQYVVAQGTFVRNGNLKPDKVQFVDWWYSHGSYWAYQIDPDRAYTDSAVLVSWYEAPLDPGRSRTYTTYYGLSELAQNNSELLGLNAYCDGEVTFNESEEEDAAMFNVLDVTAYLNSFSDDVLNNTYATITLPEGMTLAEDSTETIDFGNLEAGADVQGLWKVNTDPSMEAGDYTITITAGADGTEETSVDLKVTVPEHEMPAPTESSESQPESSSESSSESQPESSSESSSEASSSSKATVNTASTANPNTGAAGVAMLAATAALGAVVVTKRKGK